MIKRGILVGIVLLVLGLCVQPGCAGLSDVQGVEKITDQSVAGNIPGNSTAKDMVIYGTPPLRPDMVLTATPELTPQTALTINPVPASQVTPNSACTSCGFVEKYPLMHFTSAQHDAEQAQIDAAPKYFAPHQALTRSGNLRTGSKSLLSYVPYTPSERSQGSCGNCWVWASTGALEIDHTVKSGIKDRLSIQYFNSKYNNGEGSGWACCGGTLSTFTNWYNTDKTPVPWSNTNASYGDASSQCSRYVTAVPLSTIATRPNYNINSISYSTISTYGVGQSMAINNIKSALDEKKGIYYSFNYGDTGWNAFYDFWGYSNESSVFDPTPYTNETTAGGHGVLLVGYDDTDPANPYWLVLNSWGASSNRSQGLFRQKMDINYDSVYWYSGYQYQQHKFLILNSTFASNSSTLGIFRNGAFYLASGNTNGGGTVNAFNFGQAGDVPVSGDWTGSGTTTAGIFRNGAFYLASRNTNGGGTVNAFNFGQAGDVPVSGDWNADGKTEAGIFRNGAFYLASGNTNGGGTVNAFNFGQAGDVPVSGDWTGSGTTTAGIFRNGAFYLASRNTNGGGTVNAFNFGQAGDVPISGDWNADGKTEVGIFRSGTVFFASRNENGGGTVSAFTYGIPGDVVVTGKWIWR